MKTRIWLLGLFLFWVGIGVAYGGQGVNFAPLQKRLVAQGLDSAYVKAIFSRPEVRFLPQIMPRRLLHNEYKLHYEKFLAPERIARAQKFLKEHQNLLNQIEKTYGVSKEVLVGIFLIETDLGRHPGRYRTFNVLASMAVTARWEEVQSYLPKDLSPEEQKRLKAYMSRRAQWAFKELYALLKLSQKEGLDPLALRGSIFGAFGYPQFVPSSVLSYGVDWDKDGRIDLFSLEDALASMANYLAQHGWKSALSYREQIRVIKTYNHSQPYAETVLKVAEALNHASLAERD